MFKICFEFKNVPKLFMFLPSLKLAAHKIYAALNKLIFKNFLGEVPQTPLDACASSAC